MFRSGNFFPHTHCADHLVDVSQVCQREINIVNIELLYIPLVPFIFLSLIF